MGRWVQLAAAAVTAVGLPATAVVCDPPWVRALGLDVWNYPAAADDLHASTEREDALADRHDRLIARWAECDRIAAGVAAGGLSAEGGLAELGRVADADPAWGRSLWLEFTVWHPREPTGRREVLAWYLTRKLAALGRTAAPTP